MKITFIPQRNDAELSLIKQGDILFINGEEFDFSPLEENNTLPYGAVKNVYVASEVKRVDGEIELSIILPHPYIPNSGIFEPITILVERDGIVELPSVN